MHVFRTWRVLCVLGFVGASSCVNELEYEGNFANNYDNEVSQDRQEGETPTTPCRAAEFSRWDKLFIALEDSHMRQNMLLESLERCSGGMLALSTRVDELAEATCRRCLPSLEAACGARAEQANARLRQGLLELREEEAERERGSNAVLRQLLRGGHEADARLKRLEEEGGGHGAAPRPGGSGPALGPGAKTFASGPAVEKALVAVATELQQVHLRLSRVMEPAARTEEAHESPRGKKMISD